jgi:S-DNA-T family DNA segregation ATPase FtsK/SpoIIIE
MIKLETRKKDDDSQKKLPGFLIKRISEGGFILVLTCALFIFLSLTTHSSSDPRLNAGGQVGAYIAQFLYYCFGYFAYLLPLGFTFVAWIVLLDFRTLKTINKPALFLRGSGLIFLMLGGCSLLSLEPGIVAINGSQSAGGALGDCVAGGFDYALNLQGATLLLFSILLVGITLLTGLSWVNFTEKVGLYTLVVLKKILQMTHKIIILIKEKKQTLEIAKKESIILRPKQTPVLQKEIKLPEVKEFPIISAPYIPQIQSQPEETVSKQTKNLRKSANEPMTMPSLELLDKGQPGKSAGNYSHQQLENVSREVEQHLLDFGIQADVVAVHPGPVVTRFELQLAAGIKVSKLTTLAKDLARSLSVVSVRVVEVIPGKTVVGIELPNQQREVVRLSDVLSADVYQKAHSPLTIALGVDIAGHPVVVDLAKMPHLLVAGTTGSGKSVGIIAMILSLLFKAGPEQVRLIMIDPKMLELSVYDGIPHLLTPVVTDMKEAASALRWCVQEMEKRYRLMAALGVRNLTGFNTKITESIALGEPLVDPLWKPTSSMDEKAPQLETLPYVVVIIDELADMMMVVGKKVEQLIARIAQKARAAGIHLVLATQRPSVDVLTGLIKSNIPTRMSFQVSSKIDSRTILDQQGAEQLLGHGDMLYLAPGTGAPLRVHGAFVDDKEVHRIADDWRSRGEPEYIDEITQFLNDNMEGNLGEESEDTEDADPLYDQAVEFVLQTRKASISSVQRRLKIGYNRAARLVEEMERTGIVGPLEGGFRDVLVKETV